MTYAIIAVVVLVVIVLFVMMSRKPAEAEQNAPEKELAESKVRPKSAKPPLAGIEEKVKVEAHPAQGEVAAASQRTAQPEPTPAYVPPPPPPRDVSGLRKG